MTLSRATLNQLSPRARAEMRALDKNLEATAEVAVDASDTATDALATADDTAAKSVQTQSDVLDSLSGLSADLGIVAQVGTNEFAIMPFPVSFLGKGPTGSRPSLGRVGIYFDTTLAAAGKPIFYTGSGWVDATGVAV